MLVGNVGSGKTTFFKALLEKKLDCDDTNEWEDCEIS